MYLQRCFYRAALCVTCLFLSTFSYSAPVKTIAITQLVGHESLDKVRRGIIDELAGEGYSAGKQANILFENAQGNMIVASQIAQQFANQRPDVIVAIATPSAQAAASAIKQTKIPLVFASISDPIQAKLVTNLQHPGQYITGTRNRSPIDKELALIKKMLPRVKRIGVVLNNGEVNSVDVLKQVVSEAKKLNIEVIVGAVSSSAEVQTAAASLVEKVDAILLLQDNTVASALPALMKVTNAHHIPVFTTYLDAIKAGAVAGLAFDEYAIGRQTGKMIVAILAGKKAGDLPVEDPEHIDLVVNQAAAHAMGVSHD